MINKLLEHLIFKFG